MNPRDRIKLILDELGNNKHRLQVSALLKGGDGVELTQTDGRLNVIATGISGSDKTSNYKIDLYARPDGEVFQLKHRSALSSVGTSHIRHPYVEPEIFTAKTDVEIRVDVLAGGVTEAAVAAGFDIVVVDE